MKSKLIAGAIVAGVLVVVLLLEGLVTPATDEPPFGERNHEKTIVVASDITPSYKEKMAKDGAAYKFSLRVMDRYARSNGNDKVILAQIGGAKSKPLLWEGTPTDLQKAFPDAEAFRKFLLAEASGVTDSRVYDSLADILEYAMSRGGPVVTIALTDLEDNVNTADAEKRLLDVLTVYGKQHALGIYWVDQDQAKRWKPLLAERMKPRFFEIENDKNPNPILPQLD